VSTDDPRLEQALHDAAPKVATDGVVAHVARRRTRRRRNRRVAAGALAIVVLLVVGAVTVLVSRDDGSTPHVATTPARFHARVIGGQGAVGGATGEVVEPARVTLDQDPMLLQAPVQVGTGGLSIASHDPGPDGAPLSHVVRVEGTHVVDIVNFKAHILSITEGEGARWALTQNPRVTGNGTVPDAFLKRILPAGDPTSTPLPPNADPVGPIAAVGGAVWVPVRDGVLQYDTTGQFVRKTALPEAEHRWVAQVGKFAYATDGKRLSPLEVSGTAGDDITYDAEVLGLAAVNFDGRVLLAATDGGVEHARVARATSAANRLQVTATLPDGFVPTGLAASPTRTWATGTVDGAPAIALLDDTGVVATVVVEHASEGAALAWTDAHTVRAVSDGELFDIPVP
jgi:hypothetical protein